MEQKPFRKVATNMPRRMCHGLCSLACLLSLLLVAGCATTDPGVPTASNYPLTEQHRQWWAQNRARAQYIPGRGFYVEQVGYFDHEGRPMDVERPPVSPDLNTPEKKESQFSLGEYSPSRIYDAATQVVTGKANEEAGRVLYREAQGHFQRQQYAAAGGKFATAAKRFPDSPLEEDALFFVAESEYFNDRWPQADEAYATLVKKYTNTRHLDQVSRRRFAIAKFWETEHQRNPKWAFAPNFFNSKMPRFDPGGRALRTYEGIMNTDTRSELADTAIMAVGDALFADKRFEEADFRYQMLITDYPQSRFLYEAHHQALKCKLKMYQGPDYDSTPLGDAEDLVEQMLVQFPRRSAADRGTLMKFRDEVRALKAQKDWKQAEYYANRKDYRAARHSFGEIAKRYPDTNFAGEALARVRQYQDKPDTAEHPLAWATKWLPHSEEETAVGTAGRPTRNRR